MPKTLRFTYLVAGGFVALTGRPAIADPVDFNQQIKPLFESACLSCHGAEKPKGKFKMLTREDMIQGGEDGAGLVPGEPDNSPIYTLMILDKDHDDLMPPSNKGGPLAKEQTDLVKQWITEGAKWPEGVVLAAVKKAEPPAAGSGPGAAAGSAEGGNLTNSAAIHGFVVSQTQEKAPEDMKPYTETISGTGVKFDMVPIPAGEFTMGSPDAEEGRKPDEGPTVKVKISPFWMGKLEVTWAEYELFMRPEIELDLRNKNPTDESQNKLADAISRPTKPYVEMSFGMGKDGFPAISMTQHAANKYCQWLSARTGHFYRLPTEAEWEYACRAGTTTAYSFGDDPAELDDYAWHGANSDWAYQKVGKKKPNPWGLHDMHGNVVEWTLDQYDADWFKKNAGKLLVDPWNVATKNYPHVVRGGSWDDEDPAALRSAARRFSDKGWKIQDPQLPKSVWYHTDAQFLGMRVVRPLKVPTAEEMHRYWNSGVERD